MTERSRAWIAVFLNAAFIFAVSSIQRPSIEAGPWMKYQPDKLFHLVEYAFFGYFLTRAFSLTYNFRSAFALALLVFAVGSLYALSDEWHQRFVPGRDSDWHDWAADALGVIAGFAVRFRKTNKGISANA